MSDEEKKQPLIRVRMENDVADYPHNNVANAAFLFRGRLTKAFEDKKVSHRRRMPSVMRTAESGFRGAISRLPFRCRWRVEWGTRSVASVRTDPDERGRTSKKRVSPETFFSNQNVLSDCQANSAI